MCLSVSRILSPNIHLVTPPGLPCARKVFHGVKTVYHGVRKVYHGVRKVYDGVRMVNHGVSTTVSEATGYVS